MRLNEQMSEFMYEKKQSESNFSEEMKKVHEEYCSAIEDLKVKSRLNRDFFYRFNKPKIYSSKMIHSKLLTWNK